MNIPTPLHILGVPVHPVTMGETVDLVKACMAEEGLHQIATVNPEFVMTARSNQSFRALLQKTTLNIPDGNGLLWAARRLGQPFPERVPGSELIYHLAEAAAREGWRIFLLGAGPGVAAEAADVLRERYPGLRIVATYEGSPDPGEDQQITDRINASGAELLFVAYGAPNQDLWIARNQICLPMVKVAMGVGGTLDFVTGRSKRAPNWIQDLGLEWLHRLVREPWRWRRMLALPRFVWAILRTGQNVP